MRLRQVLNHFVYLDGRATHYNTLGDRTTPRLIASIMILLQIISRLLTATLLIVVGAELYLYNSTILKNATSLAPKCIEAMSTCIACDPALLTFASVGYVSSMEPSFLSETLCSSKCVSSLVAYREGVAAGCSTVDAWPGVPATCNGDSVQAYQNQTCLKSSSGEWCNSKSSATNTGFSHADTVICKTSSAISPYSRKVRNSRTFPRQNSALLAWSPSSSRARQPASRTMTKTWPSLGRRSRSVSACRH